MPIVSYKVLREHEGDKFYKAGEIREAEEAGVSHLVLSGVLADPSGEDALRQDGPTVSEYVSAGYLASNYPPQGYASRSSQEEVAAAIAAEKMERAPQNKAEKPGRVKKAEK